MLKNKRSQKGFTVIEVLVVAAIALLVATIVTLGVLSQSATFTGGFSISPVTVPAGGSANFTYHVDKTVMGRTAPESGRAITFRIEPAGILTVAPASGTTNGSGDISVTVSSPNPEYVYAGNIWAKDTKSEIEDSPVSFMVR